MLVLDIGPVLARVELEWRKISVKAAERVDRSRRKLLRRLDRSKRYIIGVRGRGRCSEWRDFLENYLGSCAEYYRAGSSQRGALAAPSAMRSSARIPSGRGRGLLLQCCNPLACPTLLSGVPDDKMMLMMMMREGNGTRGSERIYWMSNKLLMVRRFSPVAG